MFLAYIGEATSVLQRSHDPLVSRDLRRHQRHDLLRQSLRKTHYTINIPDQVITGTDDDIQLLR